MKNILWGMGWGLFSGLFLMAFAALAVLSGRGNVRMHPIVLLSIYPAGGIFAGAIVGAFRRHLRKKRMAQLIGGLIGLPIGYAVFLLEYGQELLEDPIVLVIGLLACFWLGWMLATQLWDPPVDPERDPQAPA